MNTTGITVNTPSKATTGRHSHRLGMFTATALALLSALATGAVSSPPADRSRPSSGYTWIDTSDHPTNPATCRARFSAC